MKKYLILLLILISSGLIAQKKEQLQEQNQKLQAEINRLSKELLSSKNQSQTSLVYLQNLNQKLAAREKLIRNISTESKFIDDDIYKKQLEVNGLSKDLGGLREEYAAVLVKAYKNKSVQNKIVFILSSSNFSEAYRRLKYLERYAEYRAQQANKITQKQSDIQVAKIQKEKSKQEKIIALQKEQGQKMVLDTERLQQQAVVNNFKQNEGKIVAELNQKQAARRNNDIQLENIIKEEIRLAKIKAEEERKLRLLAEKKRKEEEALERKRQEIIAKAKAEEARVAAIKARKEAEEEARRRAATVAVTSPNVKSTPIATKKVEPNVKTVIRAESKTVPNVIATKPAVIAPKPVEIKKEPVKVYTETNDNALSSNFIANKGNLPWPTEGGSLVGTFGRSEHPALKGIIIENSGVDISVKNGANARAVFGGVVSRIYAISGGNKAILIQHGDYYTVYNNIDVLYVKQGDKVTTKQTIGRVYTQSDGNTILNFQVWKGTSKQNPAGWVSNM